MMHAQPGKASATVLCLINNLSYVRHSDLKLLNACVHGAAFILLNITKPIQDGGH